MQGFDSDDSSDGTVEETPRPSRSVPAGERGDGGNGGQIDSDSDEGDELGSSSARRAVQMATPPGATKSKGNLPHYLLVPTT